MSSNMWLLTVMMCVACLTGCGDLVVDLSEEDKDELAVFVESGGQAEVVVVPESEITNLSQVTRLDHLAWDVVLRRFNDNGFIQYSAFWASPDHRELLDMYLDTLAEVDPLVLEDESERLAFWMNAYNALVFRGVVEGLESDPEFRVDTNNFIFFKTNRYVVGGQVYSLDSLEHGVIRGDRDHPSVSGLTDEEWTIYAERHASIFPDGVVDPRIHVGVNCAALSCPPLANHAFVGPELDAQLDERTLAFVFDSERGAGTGGISMLFNWFAVDFDVAFGSPRQFIEAYRDDTSDVNFDTFLNYDWALNGQ